MTAIAPAAMPSIVLLEIERGMLLLLRSFEPFVSKGKRRNAVHDATWNPHDQSSQPLVVDRIEANARHSHRGVIGIPWRRGEAHQGAERAADQRSREQACRRYAVTGAALTR